MGSIESAADRIPRDHVVTIGHEMWTLTEAQFNTWLDRDNAFQAEIRSLEAENAELKKRIREFHSASPFPKQKPTPEPQEPEGENRKLDKYGFPYADLTTSTEEAPRRVEISEERLLELLDEGRRLGDEARREADRLFRLSPETLSMQIRSSSSAPLSADVQRLVSDARDDLAEALGPDANLQKGVNLVCSAYDTISRAYDALSRVEAGAKGGESDG